MSTAWPLVRLGDVLKRESRFEKRDEMQEYHFAGTYSFARGIFPGEKKLGSSFQLPNIQRIKTDDFIYCKIMAWEGAFGIAPPIANNCVMSNAFVVYTINRDVVDSRYLSYYFKVETVWREIGKQSTGTNIRRQSLHPDQFEGSTIPLPPLAEQQRIVARVDALAARIAEARGLRAQVVVEIESLLNGENARVFEKALGQNQTRLDSVAILERGKFSFRPRNDPRFFGGEHPWIQIAEIESADKYIRGWSASLNDDGLAISKKFPKGTLLISIAATIGAVGILDFDCCVPDSIVGVTPRSTYSSEFFYYYLRYVRSHLEKLAPQSTQKNINLSILAPLPIPVVTPKEQQDIVRYLDNLQAKVDSLKAIQVETAAELDALLPSVLDQAFRGEL